MEVCYCNSCKKWFDWENVKQHQSMVSVGQINPPDYWFECPNCGHEFGEDEAEDNATEDIVDLLNNELGGYEVKINIK